MLDFIMFDVIFIWLDCTADEIIRSINTSATNL